MYTVFPEIERLSLYFFKHSAEVGLFEQVVVYFLTINESAPYIFRLIQDQILVRAWVVDAILFLEIYFELYAHTLECTSKGPVTSNKICSSHF